MASIEFRGTATGTANIGFGEVIMQDPTSADITVNVGTGKDIQVLEAVTKEITSVGSVADVNTPYGTAFANLSLPTTVQVTLDDQSVMDLGVTWLQGNYNGNAAGTYTLTGNLQLVDGVLNSSNKTASINVVVAEKPGIEIAVTVNSSAAQDGIEVYVYAAGSTTPIETATVSSGKVLFLNIDSTTSYRFVADKPKAKAVEVTGTLETLGTLNFGKLWMGDLDNDGAINLADFGVFGDSYLNSTQIGDLDNDTNTNLADFGIFGDSYLNQ